MKKKFLLIAMMISILACLFAISICADGIKVESSSIDMTISFYDANNNEVKTTVKVDEIFNVNFKNDGAEYYFKLTGVKKWDVEIDGTSYNIKSQLAGLYFPEGITHMPVVGDNYWGFTAATKTNVRKIHLPESLQDLGGNFLRGIGYVKLVNEDDTLDNYLPSSLTNVNDHLFCSWTLCNDVIYFPENFHNIGSDEKTKWHFEGFKAANGSITIVFLGKMTFVDVDTYEKNFNPTFIFVENKASDLWGYALPMVEGSTTVASTASYVSNKTSAQTLKLYWPSKDGTNASMNAGAQTATIGSTAPRLVFCDGEKIEYVMTARFNTGSSYPALYDEAGVQLNAMGVSGYGSSTWMRFYTTPIAYDMVTHVSKDVHYNKYVYQEGNCGYDEITTNTCVICNLQSVVVGQKATGNHEYSDDFNCETALNCDVCKKTLVEALLHDIKTTVTYENGYNAKGIKSVSCQNEGCKHSLEDEELAELFSFIGYSINEVGNNGIAIAYAINNSALEIYQELTGKTLNYGAFAVLKDKIGDNEIFDKNGNKANGVISVDVTEHNFDVHEFKISGFANEYMGVKLAMGAFVKITGENGTEYSYLQIGTKAENEKYVFVSYNDLIK